MAPILKSSTQWGEENFFLFGLRADEVDALRGQYQPHTYVEQDHELADVIELIAFGHFNPCEPGIFDMILGAILSPHDP